MITTTKQSTFAATRDSKRRTEELTGIFESIRWHNEDGTFIIATLKTGQTIKGNAKVGMFIRGCEYIFGGKWTEANGRFGPSFQFTSVESKPPVTREAVSAYLSKHISGIGAGIGDVGIRKLIDQFGADAVISTMKNSPKDIASFLGLDYAKAELAADTLKKIEKFETTRIALGQLFQGYGFPQSTVEACIDTFGVNATDAIKRDPFTMLVRGFHGCGFLRCNALYDALGLPKARLKRQVICLWHLLTEGNGSVWYDAEWCRQELTRMVSSDVQFVKAVKLGTRAKWLSTHRDADWQDSEKGKLWLASREHAACEHELAEAVIGFLS